MRILFLSVLVGSSMVQVAGAAPSGEARQEAQHPHDEAGEPMTDRPVANLPYSRGREFDGLDEYLAYLAQYNGPIDLPWWKEIEPGVYRHEVRNPGIGGQPEIATRDQLEKRFGFSPAG